MNPERVLTADGRTVLVAVELFDQMETRIAALTDELAAKDRQIGRYGRHDASCPVSRMGIAQHEPTCRCGFAAVVLNLSPSPPEQPAVLPKTRGCPGKVDGWPCTREPGHDGGIHTPEQPAEDE